MLVYPHLQPIAFHIGPVKVHWYGIMYLVGFAAAWALGTYRARKQAWTVVNTGSQVGDLIFYGALGVILGGRIGYMLFYQFPTFIHHPWTIVEVWDGGMSFHGGMLGVAVAMWLYSRKLKCYFLNLSDFFAPMVPIGLAAGRLGNFINDELWGRVTNSPLGMIFPKGGPLPRYPSQLLEFLLEGVVLFSLLWWISLKPRKRGTITACFLIFYACFRIFAEFFRQPDPQLGFLFFGWVTMGMVLSAPMFVAGVIMLVWIHYRDREKLAE